MDAAIKHTRVKSVDGARGLVKDGDMVGGTEKNTEKCGGGGRGKEREVGKEGGQGGQVYVTPEIHDTLKRTH